MQAAVFEKIGSPLKIEELPDPQIGPGELLIRIKSCGICGSDIHATSEAPGLPKGTVLGHEFAGEVVKVGEEVGNKWQVGDRVCSLPFISCGKCKACLAGNGHRCAKTKATGFGQVGGAYSEYARVGAFEALRLPDNVTFQEGALVEPLSVGLNAVNKSRMQRGDDVLVLGAGPIGLSAMIWAKFFGARNVVVSEKNETRLKLAEKLGATATIDANKGGVIGQFNKITGRPPSIIFEAVGAPGILQQCITMAPPDGRIVCLGVHSKPDQFMPLMAILKEVNIQFILGYTRKDFEFTIDMLSSKRIDARPMITQTVDLKRLPDMFEMLRKPTDQCKVLIEP